MTFTDHFAVQQVQRRKQRGGAIAFVDRHIVLARQGSQDNPAAREKEGG
jgi:hypothetical protein